MTRFAIQHLMVCVVLQTQPAELMATFTLHPHAAWVLFNSTATTGTIFNIDLQPELRCVLCRRFIFPDCEVAAGYRL